MNEAYVSRTPWNAARPGTLVVACSDGRLQENIDDFLSNHLGIRHYDRLYAPGGPGALSPGISEFLRSDQFRREFDFLAEAHEVNEVLLLFHGSAPDGPDDATCADYRRKMPRLSPAEIRDQHERDAHEFVRASRSQMRRRSIRVRAYRAEVTATGQVRFVALLNETV